jgi:hypothetical protein
MLPFVCRGRGRCGAVFAPFDTYGSGDRATQRPGFLRGSGRVSGPASAAWSTSPRAWLRRTVLRARWVAVVDSRTGLRARGGALFGSNQRPSARAREHGVRVDVVNEPARCRSTPCARTVAPRRPAAPALILRAGLRRWCRGTGDVLRGAPRQRSWPATSCCAPIVPTTGWGLHDRHRTCAPPIMIDTPSAKKRAWRAPRTWVPAPRSLGSVRLAELRRRAVRHTVYAHTSRMVAAARRAANAPTASARASAS